MNNEHWFDKDGKYGFSEYFWKSKYPCILEATGHTPEEIEKLTNVPQTYKIKT